MTTKTETNRTKTKTTMRKYQRKSDVSSRPFRTNIAFFPCFLRQDGEDGEEERGGGGG